MNPTDRRSMLMALALAPLAVGCTTTPPPRLYTLAARSASAPARSFTGTVLVRPVELPKYLDRPQIVRYGTEYELEIAEFDRWAESLRDMTTRVLAENLAMRLPGGQVYSGPGASAIRPEVTLETEFGRFEADASGTVVLAARWLAFGERRGASVRAERVRIDPASPDMRGLVAGMSDALARLSDQVAGSLV